MSWLLSMVAVFIIGVGISGVYAMILRRRHRVRHLCQPYRRSSRLGKRRSIASPRIAGAIGYVRWRNSEIGLGRMRTDAARSHPQAGMYAEACGSN